MIRWLLERGADVNAVRQDDLKATALMTAAKAGEVALVELLLEHGADPSLTNSEGQTALDLASDSAVKKLLRE